MSTDRLAHAGNVGANEGGLRARAANLGPVLFSYKARRDNGCYRCRGARGDRQGRGVPFAPQLPWVSQGEIRPHFLSVVFVVERWTDSGTTWTLFCQFQVHGHATI